MDGSGPAQPSPTQCKKREKKLLGRQSGQPSRVGPIPAQPIEREREREREISLLGCQLAQLGLVRPNSYI